VRSNVSPWVGRAVGIVVVLLVVVASVFVWLHANRVRSDLLFPSPHAVGFDLEVISIGGGRVVLPRTSQTERDGVWGLESDDAYAQVGEIIRIDTEVERALHTLIGSIEAGDAVRLDADAFPGDPKTAHGIGYEDVRVPGELGPQPAWLIEGRRDTWVVFLHGEGVDRRAESLRMVPVLVEEGFSVIVATYRNDLSAPASADGMRRWGLDEWRDVEAAMLTADRKGAEDFVLYAHGLGAEVASMFLHESDLSGRVSAVVFDSPILDLEQLAADHTSLISPLAEAGRTLAAIRFGIEWQYLDQIERAAAFDVPMLLMHGARDPVVPFSSSKAFADLRPDLVRLQRFERGEHGDLWNSSPQIYEDVVTGFLEDTHPEA